MKELLLNEKIMGIAALFGLGIGAYFALGMTADKIVIPVVAAIAGFITGRAV